MTSRNHHKTVTQDEPIDAILSKVKQRMGRGLITRLIQWLSGTILGTFRQTACIEYREACIEYREACTKYIYISDHTAPVYL